MQYIKAKFMKNEKPTGRSYTYRCEDDVKPGEFVANVNGTKLMVMDEPVDEEWIKSYGEKNIATVKKYVERKVDIDSLDDHIRCMYCTYEPDCPKGVRCYGGEPFFPYCSEHDPEDWFDEEEYLKDFEESEEK